MGLAADVVTYLGQAGYGTPGTDLFWGSRAVVPDGDGPFTVVTDTGGLAPEFIHNQDEPSKKHRTAQVMVRALSIDAALAAAERAYRLLTVWSQTIGAAFYLALRPLQEPADLGQDPNGRALIGFNLHGEVRV